MTVFAATLTFPGIVAAFTGNGEGTEGNPYQITTCDELQEIKDDMEANYILTQNIDCSDTETWNDGAGFEPIGDWDTQFSGSFDGQGHTISDLYINRPGHDGVGLFGFTLFAQIANVGLVDVDITGGDFVGGLIGYIYVIGSNVRTSYVTGNVSGDTRVGGLVGFAEDWSFSIQGIEDSYTAATVSGNTYVGGLVGYSIIAINRSFSAGAVTGANSGGLVGTHGGSPTTNSFWDTDTSNQPTSAGGTGLSTEEMQELATFTGAGWDIEATDTDLNNGYPFLAWQAGDNEPVWYVWDGTPPPEPDPSPANSTTHLTSPVTGKAVTLEVDQDCDIKQASMSPETSNVVQDSGYDYPAGLMFFTLDCGTPGYTTTVTQTFVGLDDENLILRKHNPDTNAYFTIKEAVITRTTVNGQPSIVVSYQVTDGGKLDLDGQENGVIVDPVGLAQSTVGVPDTGLGGRLYN